MYKKIVVETLRKHQCPECNVELIGNLVQDGRRKGHGTIYCPKCKKVLRRVS